MKYFTFIITAYFLAVCFRFGMKYTGESQGAAGKKREGYVSVPAKILRSAIFAVLPPASINIYLALQTEGPLPVFVLTGFFIIHILLVDKICASPISEQGIKLLQFTIFHLISAVLIWQLLLT